MVQSNKRAVYNVNPTHRKSQTKLTEGPTSKGNNWYNSKNRRVTGKEIKGSK